MGLFRVFLTLHTTAEAERRRAERAEFLLALVVQAAKGSAEELWRIDFLLSRRDAIDHLPTRVEKIRHALATAAKAEPGRRARMIQGDA